MLALTDTCIIQYDQAVVGLLLETGQSMECAGLLLALAVIFAAGANGLRRGLWKLLGTIVRLIRLGQATVIILA